MRGVKKRNTGRVRMPDWYTVVNTEPIDSYHSFIPLKKKTVDIKSWFYKYIVCDFFYSLETFWRERKCRSLRGNWLGTSCARELCPPTTCPYIVNALPTMAEYLRFQLNTPPDVCLTSLVGVAGAYIMKLRFQQKVKKSSSLLALGESRVWL